MDVVSYKKSKDFHIERITFTNIAVKYKMYQLLSKRLMRYSAKDYVH